MTLKIRTDFSKSPGPRYIEEGPNSGQKFRKDVLWPHVERAIAANEILDIDLDGTSGYGTSFLEEAFGGLIRENGLTLAELKTVLKFTSNEEPELIDEIEEDMYEAEMARRAKK